MKRVTVPNAELFSEVRRLIAEGREVTILARGSSMLPFIRDGVDKVLLAPVTGRKTAGGTGPASAGPAAFSVGDILLCEVAPGRFVLHRLIGIDGGRLILMGDGNLRGTESCTPAEVIAGAVRILHPDGTATDCTSPSELRKARIWRRLLPFRRILLAVWRRTRRAR